MSSLLTFVVCGLGLLQSFGASNPVPRTTIPHYFQRSASTPNDLSVWKVRRELGPMLSKGSVIFGPSNPAFENATERWNIATEPDIEIVVQPAQESDVSKIVKYCNKNSIGFLATNRGHGASGSLATFKGLQIDLRTLNGIKIQPGGKSAWLQGGAYIGQTIPALWDAGYVTATGSSDCVGISGPALGGGHGRYQGLYGLASDNFINLNVILADGSAIMVNETSHNDLFWAMKGAGHNFGIVTSVESKIYPREVDTWHYHNYVWTQDKLEEVFTKLNVFHLNGNTPPKMGVAFGSFAINPSFSTTEIALEWYFAYAGPAVEAEELLKPFNEIGAVSEESGDIPYTKIPAIQNMGENAPECDSHLYVGSSAGLLTYNVITERAIYQLLNKTITAHPSLAATSQVFHEGYSTKAVQAINPDSSAYPHRDDLHLVFFTAAILEPDLQVPAQQLAAAIRDLWYAGQPGRLPTTYVNYATGAESLESIYGYESWRLKKLRGLKGKYDPKNRFRFYAPIVSE